MGFIQIAARLFAISLLPFFVIAQLISKLFLRNYRKPLYQLQCTYELLKLKKGLTEILRIHKKKPNKDQNSNLSSLSEDKEILTNDTKIVIMSGNPGFVRFYDRFTAELSKELNNEFDIFGIGHLGQFNYSGKPIHNDFTLIDQIEQKTEFLKLLIQKYPNSKFILISHSIGSYVALNVLEAVPSNKILFSCMLYPVIERIKDTPNGKSTAKLPYFPHIYLSSFFVGFLSFLPLPVKRLMIKHYLEKEQRSIDEDLHDVVEVAAQYLSYSNFYSMLFMTRTEFSLLNERQSAILNKHSEKILLYYGLDDKWCPVQYFNDIRQDMPGLNAQLDSKGFLHAFVIGGSTLKAQLISELLKNKLGDDLLGEL